MKLNSIGDIEWQNSIGGSGDDRLYSTQQTTDGGYILGGYSDSGISGDKTEASLGYDDYWIVKLDSTGTIEWQNTIGGDDMDLLYSLQQTIDGGYILGGYSHSEISGDKTHGSFGQSDDYWVLKLDSLGIIEWQRTIGGHDGDRLYSIGQTSDSGYILGGWSDSDISGNKTENSINYSPDYWIVKLKSDGTIQWQNTIGGNGIDELSAIQQTSDGGYIMGGDSYSGISGDKTEASVGDGDYWVVKLDSIGLIEWQNTIGGNGEDDFNYIQQTSDDGYILGGFSSSGISGDKTEASFGERDMWVLKLNSIGVIEWQKTIGGDQYDYVGSIEQIYDGSFIIGGFSSSGISGDKTDTCTGAHDYWVVKLSDSLIVTEANLTSLKSGDLSVFPNPAHDQINISVDEIQLQKEMEVNIYDPIGRMVLHSETENNESNLAIDVSLFTSGLYLIELRTTEGSYRTKFTKQ